MAHSEMCAHFSKSSLNMRRRIETNYLITLELCIDRKYRDLNRHNWFTWKFENRKIESARCYKGNPRKSVRTQSVKSMGSLPKLSIIHGPRKRSSSVVAAAAANRKWSIQTIYSLTLEISVEWIIEITGNLKFKSWIFSNGFFLFSRTIFAFVGIFFPWRKKKMKIYSTSSV